MISFQQTVDVTREQTGVVIPVYLPEGIDRDVGAQLVRDTVMSYAQQVADPSAVCISVDGEQNGADIGRQLASEFAVNLVVGEENRGKFFAAQNGARALLHKLQLRHIAVVDQDGDHFANELPNMIRTAIHMESDGHDRLLILGSRSSRHRPMGLLRGELEELADRVLLDALHYDAVVRSAPLNLQFATSLEEFPDFHSGFKVFSRPSAEAVFAAEPQLCGVDDTCFYRHAVEAVMTVEAMYHGAVLGIVSRRTVNEQPVSTFGLYNRSQMIANMIIWPCRRLQVPVDFVRQWMDNHIPRLMLSTMVPDGKEELLQIRQLVLKSYGHDEPLDALSAPMFV